MPKKISRYWLLLVLAMGIFGALNAILGKIVLRELSPFHYTFIRFILAFLFILPLIIHQFPKKHLWKLFLVSLFGAGNVIIFAFGIMKTTANASSIIYLLSPVITLLLGSLFLRHTFKKSSIRWVILWLMGGLAVVVLPIIYTGQYNVWSLTGNLIVVVAMISFVIYNMRSKPMQKTFSYLTITAGFFITTLLISGVVSLFHPQALISQVAHLSYYARWSLLFVGLLWTGLNYLIHQLIIKKTSYIGGSLFLYVQPIATVLLAITILNEKVTWLFVIASVISLIWVGLSSQEKSEATP